MRANKTIMITAPYFPPQGGGLERYASEVAKRLAQDYGWRVVVVASDERKTVDHKEVRDGMTIYHLRPDVRFSNTPLALSWIWKLRRIIRDEKPDIMNIHTPVPGLGDLASLVGRKIPQVVTYHTGSMKKGNLLDALILPYEKSFLKLMLGRAGHIICSSDFVREGFLQKYAAKSTTITPGVDCEAFAPLGSGKGNDAELLFVAKLERGQEYKGLRTLLDVIRLLRDKHQDIALKIVGDGEMRKEYEAYARKLQIEGNVRFLGAREGKELADAYRSAGIFVLPTSNDSQPLVILEAMASGLAIISTRIGGIPTMITDGEEGLLIAPGDAAILAATIEKLFKDTELRSCFGKRARQRALRSYSWDVRLSAYEQILQAALEDERL